MGLNLIKRYIKIIRECFRRLINREGYCVCKNEAKLKERDCLKPVK